MKFTIPVPDDFHLHLREGEMLRAVLPYTARHFRRAVIMPNTTNPILNANDVYSYRKEIVAASRGFDFEPLMTIQITENTQPDTIIQANLAGAVAGKIYPRGMTTNAENGVLDYQAIYPALARMEKCRMLALFHGEFPDQEVYCLDREAKFFPILKNIVRKFPRLKIVLEHITTAKAVDFVAKLSDNVAATITAHHLCLTLNDVIGDKLEPHHFCKPVAKSPSDRAALITAAMSGNQKFFFGSDSAPHLREDKECASGCAGVYTAPVALQILMELFDQHDALNKLPDFCSGFGAYFYGLPRNVGTVMFTKKKWRVPDVIDGIVPFRTGEELEWQLEY